MSPLESRADWRRVRQWRATPPGMASGDAARLAVFAAALEQAEQLGSAAEAADYASRPLPLFYVLSQAGRAIAATLAPNDWRYEGHGIKFQADSDPSRLLYSKIKPAPKNRRPLDAFQVVSGATSSPCEIGEIDLATLWYSLPELPDLFGIPGRRPLYLQPEHGDHWLGATAAFVFGYDGADIVGGALREWVDGAEASFARHGTLPKTAVVEWRDDSGKPRLVSEVAYRTPSGGMALRPLLGGELAVPPSPLMTWWLLLYAFSHIARYSPEVWVAALDVDQSVHSTGIETMLDLALARVPTLIAESLGISTRREVEAALARLKAPQG